MYPEVLTTKMLLLYLQHISAHLGPLQTLKHVEDTTKITD